jgi:SEC-C motif-containing protein
MAARYAAFVLGDAGFLHRTLHKQHDDYAAGIDGMRRALRAQGKKVRYQGLTILDERDADASGAACVLFHAAVRSGGRDVSFVELSYFVHDGAGWRYLAGEPCLARELRGFSDMDIAAFEARR